MSRVIDLNQWRLASRSLSHPAGVTLPLENPGHVDLIIPQIRSAIASGRHCGDVLRALGPVIRAGERVLVVGSGLGVLSTVIAKACGVEQVIAIEPNIALADYIEHVHRLNGVSWIETLNAVPVEKARGRVPMFVRHDIRTSSLTPDDGPWKQVMLVPGVDLDLILTEARISLIVGESTGISGSLLARARLESVDRMLFGCHDATGRSCEHDKVTARLAARGFSARRFRTALMLDRAQSTGNRGGGRPDWRSLPAGA